MKSVRIVWGESGRIYAVPQADMTDCPHCAARDTVLLETGEHFCPWCLYSWTDVAALMLGPDAEGAGDFLDDLTHAFKSD
jgi:hypothetical protein